MRYVSVRTEAQREVWTIFRPDRRNALGPTILEELEELLKKLSIRIGKKSNMEAPRVLFITCAPTQTSTSQKQSTWMAGGDIKELAMCSPVQKAKFAARVERLLNTISELPIPSVCLVSGSVIGGACEFILGADFCVATESSIFDFRQLARGLPAGFGGIPRLIEAVGRPQAARIMFTSAQLTSREALEFGLIGAVVKDNDALCEWATKLHTDLMAAPREAVVAMKRMFTKSLRGDSAPIIAKRGRLFGALRHRN